MTNPTPDNISPQGAPNNSARCHGSGSYEDGKFYWREGCDDCQRRVAWTREALITPPPIIAFECEYRIGPDKNAAQGYHAPGPEPLSPAAQAVLDSMRRSYDHEPTRRVIASQMLWALAKHLPIQELRKEVSDEFEQGMAQGQHLSRAWLEMVSEELRND